MSRIVVDLAQVAAAAVLGDRVAEGAAGVAYTVAGLAGPDLGRSDSSARLATCLEEAGVAVREMARLAAQDADLLRTAAGRYAAAEHAAGGPAPCP